MVLNRRNLQHTTLIAILLLVMAMPVLHAQDTLKAPIPLAKSDTANAVKKALNLQLKQADSSIMKLPAPPSSTPLKPHSAHKATLYSLFLPGLGQAYNHKYWKIPIVYAGFAATGYFAFSNQSYYLKFREAYNYTLAGRQDPIDNEYVGRYTLDQLKSQRDLYRRNMEFSFVLAGLVYILNVIDATVDAHLFNYDVSDDITIKLYPGMKPINHLPATNGITLSLNF
jgi:hypothetical protein